MSFSEADEFVRLSLPSVVAHVEYGFHKLNRLTTLLKKVVNAEEAYAKELQSLLRDLPAQYNDGPTSPVTVQTPSSLVLSAVVDILSKEAQIHLTKSQQINKLVVQPLKDLKDKGEGVRKKMKDDGASLEKKTRDLRDSLTSERLSCQKAFDSYKAESEAPAPSSNANAANSAANSLKSRLAAVGAKKPVDLPTLHKQFVKYESAVTNGHETQRQLYDTESKLLREWQGMEEERLKAVKLYCSKFGELVTSTFVEPLASLTMNLDRTITHFNASDDICVSASACRETQKLPRELTLIEYGLPIAPGEVLNLDKAGNGTTGEMKKPPPPPSTPVPASKAPAASISSTALKPPLPSSTPSPVSSSSSPSSISTASSSSSSASTPTAPASPRLKSSALSPPGPLASQKRDVSEKPKTPSGADKGDFSFNLNATGTLPSFSSLSPSPSPPPGAGHGHHRIASGFAPPPLPKPTADKDIDSIIAAVAANTPPPPPPRQDQLKQPPPPPLRIDGASNTPTGRASPMANSGRTSPPPLPSGGSVSPRLDGRKPPPPPTHVKNVVSIGGGSGFVPPPLPRDSPRESARSPDRSDRGDRERAASPERTKPPPPPPPGRVLSPLPQAVATTNSSSMQSVADRMKAMKLPVSAMSPTSSSGAFTSPKHTPTQSTLHSPSSSSFGSSSSSSSSSGSRNSGGGGGGGSETTLLKIYLPNDISYTLSAMQCPTVSFIKKKVIAKLERQGAEGLSGEKVQKAAIRVIGMGEDLEEKMPINVLLSKASSYMQGKTLELEIVVSGLAAPSSTRPNLANISHSPASSNNSLLASASSPSDDLSHATLERPKMVRPKKKKKKRAVKAGSGLVSKFDANVDPLSLVEEAAEENEKHPEDIETSYGGKDEDDG